MILENCPTFGFKYLQPQGSGSFIEVKIVAYFSTLEYLSLGINKLNQGLVL
jgi:hypothetical protein